MGAGLMLSLPANIIDKNKVEKVIIKQDGYVYQVNKRGGEIEKVYVFNGKGECKGLYDYDELESKHREKCK